MKDLEKIKKHLRDIFAESLGESLSGEGKEAPPEETVSVPAGEKPAMPAEEADGGNAPGYEHGALAFLRAVGRRNQFKVNVLHKSGNDALCAFKYQGGYFVVRLDVKQPFVFLQFVRFAELPYSKDNYRYAMHLCHRCNVCYSYAKFTFTYEEESHSLQFNIAIETIEPSERAFVAYLGICMRIANEVREYVSGSKEGELPFIGNMPPDTEEDIGGRRDVYLLAKAEMAYEDRDIRRDRPQARRPQTGSVGEYLAYLFDGEQTEDLLSLTVQTDGQVREITGPQLIADYVPMSSVVSGKGRKAKFVSQSPVVLTIDATSNHYVFTLHPLLDEKDFLSVRMTAVRTPHEFLQQEPPSAVYTPQAFSLKLCHTKKAAKPAEDDSQPNKKERFITGYVSKSLFLFQRADELVRNECYLQALVLLHPAYESLKMQYWELQGRSRALFFAICYDIGFCYTGLRLFEKAYFYLDLARESNRYDCEQMYFNSLAEGRDIRIFEDLQSEIEETRRSIQDARSEEYDLNDEETDSDDIYGETADRRISRMMEYYAFLQRRLGYSQINFGFLDAAEETFRKLLRHDGSRDYARQELKRIARLRTSGQPRKPH